MKKLLVFLLIAALWVPVAFAEDARVRTDTQTIVHSTDGVVLATFEASFPQFESLDGDEVWRMINEGIQEPLWTESEFHSIAAYAAEDLAIDKEHFLGTQYQLSARAYVSFTTERLVSVGYVFEGYAGGATGWNWFTARMFDRETGERVTVDSLVSDPAALRTLVADAVLAQIAAPGFPEVEDLFGGYGETVGEWPYENALFSPDGLDVFFNPEELAPHAIGLLSFTIPYADLDGLWISPVR